MEISDVGRKYREKKLFEPTVFYISASISLWSDSLKSVRGCTTDLKFESRAAELKLCIPDLEMYTSEQLQTHAVTAACVIQSKSLFHCTE